MAMCDLGATDLDLAQEFEVAPSTIWLWQAKHPEFASAVRIAKEHADSRVERSLYQRAVGYSFDSTRVFMHEGKPTTVPLTEHVAPDVGACKLWLCNRKPKEWRETSKVVVTGENDAPVLDTKALARALLAAAPVLGADALPAAGDRSSPPRRVPFTSRRRP
jgi:hypothetical protein